MPPKSMLAENDMWDIYIVPYVVTIDELGHGDGEQDAVEGVAGGGHAGKESCRAEPRPVRRELRGQRSLLHIIELKSRKI